jgi:hypothetical protein
MRYFGIAAFGVVVCGIVAVLQGSAAGWPWLVGSISLSFVGLWSLIEARHFDTRIMLHTLPDNLRRSGSEALA